MQSQSQNIITKASPRPFRDFKCARVSRNFGDRFQKKLVRNGFRHAMWVFSTEREAISQDLLLEQQSMMRQLFCFERESNEKNK